MESRLTPAIETRAQRPIDRNEPSAEPTLIVRWLAKADLAAARNEIADLLDGRAPAPRLRGRRADPAERGPDAVGSES